jgi:hypothetical protein
MRPSKKSSVIVNVVSTCQRASKSRKSASSALPEKNQAQNEIGKKPSGKMKGTFWQRTIPVLGARLAACPLPVVDNRVCTATAKATGAADVLLVDAGQILLSRQRHAAIRRCGDVLRGQHILGRPAACSETLSITKALFFDVTFQSCGVSE